MDSLLATYASSDEEDEEQHQQPQPQPQPSSSLFSSLPKPHSSSSSSSSSVFSSNPALKSSAFFSTLPSPKTLATPDFPLPPPNPKRVVQFRPPVPQLPSRVNKEDDDDEEEDEDDEEERELKNRRQMGQDTSVKSFLSSMPTPKNSGASTLGSMAPSLGSGRRSIIETEASSSDVNGVNNELDFGSNVETGQENLIDGSNLYNNKVGFGSNVENGQENLVDGSNLCNYEVGVAGDQGYGSYGSYGVYGSSSDYGSYQSYGHYDGSNWHNASSGESFVSVGGKRRKDQAPTEIVEVKQDELMKNRPREDKSKLTGIAFGPSYQPASSKGKPSKLQKRKHQISSLYFDMKQKEMELAERRAKGFLTKAETQAKYGW